MEQRQAVRSNLPGTLYSTQLTFLAPLQLPGPGKFSAHRSSALLSMVEQMKAQICSTASPFFRI
jgi:hypothetical protein